MHADGNDADLPDADLVARAAAGDREAFASLYDRHQAAIFGFALHMTGSRDTADDIVQEVFVALMRNLGRFDAQRSLPAYLYGIARRMTARRRSRDRRQALLEERFKVRVHREVRQIPVYELHMTSGGHKLRPFKEGSCTPVGVGLPRLPAGEVPCAGRTRRVGPHMTLDARRTTLDEFGWFLGLVLDRPVVDKTGVSGLVDAFVEFTPDESNPRKPPAPPTDEPATAPSLFTALQEQLGLKLEATQGPGEFIVIDQVERPTEN